MNSNDILFSIIIPAYNSEKTITSCVQSILEQIEGLNCEIICINDGSQDGTANILDDLAEKYAVIRVIHQENQGVSITRNMGGLEAKGKWITFVDSDDCFEPDSFKEAVEVVKRYDNCDMVVFDYVEKNALDAKPMFSNAFSMMENTMEPRDYLKELLIKDKMMVIHSLFNKFYRRDIFRKVFLPEDVHLGEDAIFNYDYMDYVKTICTSSISYYIYNNFGNSSLSRGRTLADTWEAYRGILSALKDALDRLRLAELYDDIKLRYCLGSISQYVRTKNSDRSDEAVLLSILIELKEINIHTKIKGLFSGIVVRLTRMRLIRLAVLACRIKRFSHQ